MTDLDSLRKRSESARDSEASYRALFNAIDDGFCIIEVLFDGASHPVDYRFLETNPAFERQAGLKGAQGQKMRDLAPRHEEHWFEVFGKVALTGKPVRFINRAAALNRWFDVFAFSIGEPESRRVGVLFSDITEARRSEQALRESEQQLRLIFESATEYAIVVSDCDRRVTAWNTGAERLLGYAESEVLGKCADILFTPEDRAVQAPEKETRVAREEGRAINERWHVRKDGTRFWGERPDVSFA